MTTVNVTISEDDHKLHLVLNEQTIPRSQASVREIPDKDVESYETGYMLLTEEREIYELILGCTVNQLSKYFSLASFGFLRSLFGFERDSYAFLEIHNTKDRGLQFLYSLVPITEKWKHPYSASEYRDKVKDLIEKRKDVKNAEVEQYMLYAVHAFRISLDFPPQFPSKTIQENIILWQPIVQSIFQAASQQLEANTAKDTLVTSFNFPPSVQVACEQYLIYFVQFLRDLGIKAEANITHQAQQVLFSVTPQEGEEALERIREALNAYLQLPSAPDFAAATARETDIAVFHLNSQVQHLNSQIMLAKATMQAKDAAIEFLQLTNFKLKEELVNARQLAKLKAVDIEDEKKPSDNEPIAGGVIEITPIEAKKIGIIFNAPEIARWLKKLKRN